MARPERNSVDYFPFFCEEGKKMYYIEETYGNDGFATFLKILRELAKADYHYLDLSKGTTKMFLSAKCKVSKEVLESIITDLVELDKFNRVLWEENSIVWCQDFVDSIQDAYSKRKNKCITFDGLLLLLTSLGVRKPSKSKSTVPVNTQSKVEYSKVKKSKVLTPSEKSSNFSFKKSLIENNVSEITANDYMLVRNKLKAVNTETAFNMLFSQIKKTKYTNEQIIALCVEKSWKSFKASWDITGMIESSTVKIDLDTEYVTFKSNVNPTHQRMTKNEFNSLKLRTEQGGYVYTIIKNS